MNRFSIAQRVNFVKLCYKNGDSPARVYRALRSDFGRHGRPTEYTIGNVERKFEETGSVADIVTPVHHRNVRSAENIAAVAASVEDEPNVSIPRRAQQLGLSNTSLWQILHMDLHLHPYKVQLVQKLEHGDHGMRRADVDNSKMLNFRIKFSSAIKHSLSSVAT